MSKQADEKQKEKDVTEKQFIGIKELHQNLKDIADAAQAGKSFTVMRHNQPTFRIRPLNLKPEASRADDTYSGEDKYSLEDLKEIQLDSDDTHTVDGLLEACSFASEEGDLSKRVDEIVYGL